MLTLEQYNKNREEHYKLLLQKGFRTNIKCPECENGQFYWRGALEDTDNPLIKKMIITCDECGLVTSVLK